MRWPGSPPRRPNRRSCPGPPRAAILAADAGSPSDKFTIDFGASGTIDLQSPLPAGPGPRGGAEDVQPAP
jgi:hypothetical protein